MVEAGRTGARAATKQVKISYGSGAGVGVAAVVAVVVVVVVVVFGAGAVAVVVVVVVAVAGCCSHGRRRHHMANTCTENGQRALQVGR